ncbi:MAG TPA: DUF748 domain-containing protein [Janthinobacterium sp.]|nr:DUF748 domain-containing protein [Janthinobacterium sp.]
MQTINIKWKRWRVGAAAAALVTLMMLVYTAAGFWLLPYLLKSQLPKFAQTELQRRAAIGEISFNPYTLRLEAADIHLSEADGAPLFAIGKLVVELDWRSLFRRAWSFAEIRITAPDVSLAIAPDGRFNIAEFMATLNRKPHEASAGMPRLIIGRFALERGKVDMDDRRAGYADRYAPIDFALNNLSTLPDEDGNYTFSADAAHGGKLYWKGSAGLNPIDGSGLLTLENVSLPGLAAYLKSYTRATLTDGKLSAKLPYRFSYKDGRFDASLTGAGLALRDLALAQAGAAEPFATLKLFEVSDVAVDLGRRMATVGAVSVADGALAVRRDAKGQLDLANLMLESAPAATPASAPAPAPAAAAAGNWKLRFKQLGVDRLAFHAVDETARPALKLSADHIQLHLKLDAEQAAAGVRLTVADAAFSLANLALASGAQTPLKLAQIGFSGGAVDFAARHASLGRLYADGGQFDLARDAKGRFTILSRLPRFDQAPVKAAAPADAAWSAEVKSVELSKFGARLEDAATGIKSTVQDVNLKLDGASSDLKQPVSFSAGLALREGGQLSAQGKLVPASGALDAQLSVKRLALAPLQPLLGQYLKLKLAGGEVNAKGRLSSGPGGAKNPALRYAGSFDVAGLVLNEDDGDLFASWKNVGTDKLSLSLRPNLLDIPELRVVQPNAKLIIENDRSFNAARLLVQPAARPKPQGAGGAFPVRIRRVRFQDAKLDFADLSLRPQFGAKIYALNGVVTGLSSKGDARSRIELDGRVDEFGLARVRGELNPFIPADNTDVNLVFKNVDMVSASPYSMKFAGYKIAEGKISLDLQYKLRKGQLEGQNQIVIDKLTLGERIDSPDALKLPLELALAILKDGEGRIDLALPVSGDMNDPQFSYGAVLWKALDNVLSKIASSPFRALGNLLGVSGDKLEAIDFDAGSALLLPPEREKLNQVAKLLAKRTQLTLRVPGQYSEEADGAALRKRALRREVASRAGLKLEAGEEPGPLSLGERKVRGALRELYAERFGAAELDKQKKAAEAAPGGAVADSTEAARTTLPVWQRLGKMIQGEPQVADAGAFYARLQERLEQTEALAAGALPALGMQRAETILAALKGAGVNPAAMHAAAAEKVDADTGKAVPLKLGLAAK